MNELRKAFGDRIRNLRKSRGFSQESFAEKADLHPTYIGGVERGERNLSLNSIEKIANALEISLSELFNFHTTEKPTTEDELLTGEILGLVRDLEPKSKRLVTKVLKSLVKELKNY